MELAQFSSLDKEKTEKKQDKKKVRSASFNIAITYIQL